MGSQTLDVRLNDPSQLEEATNRVQSIINAAPLVDEQTGRLSAAVTGGEVMPAIVRSLDEADIGVSELSLRLPSLDDVFLTLTGHRAALVDEKNEKEVGA